MGLIRLQPWELKEVGRCALMHTNTLTVRRAERRQHHLPVYSMCQSKPTDSSRLQTPGVLQSFRDKRGKKGVEALKHTEPQLVWIPKGAPGSPTKHRLLL